MLHITNGDPSPGFHDSRIRLTDTGRKVLNGEETKSP
jgi:hypothetical protein